MNSAMQGPHQNTRASYGEVLITAGRPLPSTTCRPIPLVGLGGEGGTGRWFKQVDRVLPTPLLVHCPTRQQQNNLCPAAYYL